MVVKIKGSLYTLVSVAHSVVRHHRWSTAANWLHADFVETLVCSHTAAAR